MLGLFDNDIIFKLAKCDLLDDAVEAFGVTRTQALYTARFCIARKPKRSLRDHLDADTRARIEAFLHRSESLDADPDDQDFLALCEGIDNIDTGEAILLSFARRRDDGGIFTADRKFFLAVEANPGLCDQIAHMKGRIICIQQVLLALIEHRGFEYVCSKADGICDYDTGLRLIFRTFAADPEAHAHQALMSGIREAQRILGDLLYDYPACSEVA